MPATMPIGLTPLLADRARVSGIDNLENFTISLDVHDAVTKIKAEWDSLAEQCNATVYQSRYWSELCLTTLEKKDHIKPQIVTGRHCGKLIFVLPLVLDGTYSKILRWIGGNHSNICQGLCHPEFAHHLTKDYLIDMFHTLFKDVSGVGVICLENQPQTWNGITNPLISLPNQPGVNNSFGIVLEKNFANVLNKGNAKRKRKKFRQQCRTAEQHGGYRFLVASNGREAEIILNVFLTQKSTRFRKLGISNVFADEETRLFLQQLGASLDGENNEKFKLFALEIGGEIRAVFGGGLEHGHLSGYFSSIAEDELVQMSPGEMLLYLMIEYCCETGVKSLDLGTGDERYKRSWCDSEIELFEVIRPLNRKSIPFAAFIRHTDRLKKQVRSQPALWSSFRKIRQIVR